MKPNKMKNQKPSIIQGEEIKEEYYQNSDFMNESELKKEKRFLEEQIMENSIKISALKNSLQTNLSMDSLLALINLQEEKTSLNDRRLKAFTTGKIMKLERSINWLIGRKGTEYLFLNFEEKIWGEANKIK